MREDREIQVVAAERYGHAEKRDAKWEGRVTQHDREMAAIRKNLDRAFTLSVLDARNERKRRRKMDTRFDEKMAHLAAAQRLTGQALKEFIESMRRGAKGHS